MTEEDGVLFRILHLGDLHVQASDRWSDGRAAEMLEGIEEAAKLRPPHMLICTGDIGDRGLRASIRRGFELLVEVRQRVESAIGKSVPVLVVPGNHDTHWPETWSLLEKWNPTIRTSSFRKYAAKLHDVVIRPPLTEKERKNALGDLETGLTVSKWFFWSTGEADDVFVLPISSIEYGGGLHTLSKQSKKIEDIKKSIESTSVPASLAFKDVLDQLDKITLDDMPYISRTFLDRLSGLPNRWDSTTRERFGKSLKIAVVHHPLCPVADEQEVRAFDAISNGAVAFNVLTELGFHVVLYGHKHLFGTRVLRGADVEAPGFFASDRRELVAVAGGLVGSRYPAAHYGFQILEVRRSVASSTRREVVLRRYLTRHSAGESDPKHDPSALCTVDGRGDLLWLSAADKGRRLSRSCSAVSLLEEMFSAFESSPEIVHDYGGDGVAAVESALGELIEFARAGARGVDTKFDIMVGQSADTSDALAFVDFRGRSTWYHEGLLTFLLRLSMIYSSRNQKSDVALIFSEYLRKELSNLGCAFPIDKNCKDSNGRTIHGLALVRLLVWNKEDLKTAPAKSLVKFHQLFRVPLLWCDPKDAPDLEKVYHKDFHLEWPGSQRRKRNAPRPVNDTDIPDNVWYYDEAKGQRVEVEDRAQRRIYWSVFQAILKRSEPLWREE